MKIEFINNKIKIYLYQEKLDIKNQNNLNNQIKKIFLKLIKKYHLDLFGLNKVDLYYHDKDGSIIEINKIASDDFHLSLIDLKLVVHEKNIFYLEMDDYLINDSFYQNGKYYINIDKLPNIYPYLEYGIIVANIK